MWSSCDLLRIHSVLMCYLFIFQEISGQGVTVLVEQSIVFWMRSSDAGENWLPCPIVKSCKVPRGD